MFQFIADWRRGRAERKEQEAFHKSYLGTLDKMMRSGTAVRTGLPEVQWRSLYDDKSIWHLTWGLEHLYAPDRPWFDFRLRTEDVYFDRVPVPQRFYDSMVDEYGEPHVSRFYEVQAPEDPILFECPHCYMDVRESDLLENDDDQD